MERYRNGQVWWGARLPPIDPKPTGKWHESPFLYGGWRFPSPPIKNPNVNAELRANPIFPKKKT